MGENQERRQAHRQKRGLLRVEEILRAAGTLYTEAGYDNVTTGMIAARAGLSQGSLYQFFPNKEAIAQAFASHAAERLHGVYATLLAPEMMGLPITAFLDAFLDAIIAFNRANPGYLALTTAANQSPPLALSLAELQHGLLAHLDAVMAAQWPQSTGEERSLPLLISYRLFLALLPLVIQGEGETQAAIVREMKVVFFRYWETKLGT